MRHVYMSITYVITIRGVILLRNQFVENYGVQVVNKMEWVFGLLAVIYRRTEWTPQYSMLEPHATLTRTTCVFKRIKGRPWFRCSVETWWAVYEHWPPIAVFEWVAYDRFTATLENVRERKSSEQFQIGSWVPYTYTQKITSVHV